MIFFHFIFLKLKFFIQKLKVYYNFYLIIIYKKKKKKKIKFYRIVIKK